MAENVHPEEHLNQVPAAARPGAHDADRAIYNIRVKGCLDSSWSDWFDGLAITPDRGQGETTLSGAVQDQAELHGLLNKVRNLGLTLLWLHRQEAWTTNLQDR